MTKPIADTWTVFLREVTPVVRDPVSLAFSLVQPIVLLGLFGPLLAGTVPLGAFGADSTLAWFVPGVLVMLTLFGTAGAGYSIMTEMQTGSHERLLVTPLVRSSLLTGRALKELVPLTIQAAVIVLALLPSGLEVHPLHALLGLLLLGAFGIGFGACTYALAIASKDRDWLYWGVFTTLQFPLLILSGTLLPLDAAPTWMRTVALFNPLTYLVDAERAIFAGNLGDPAIAWGVAATVATCAVGLTVGIHAMRRSDG